MRMSDAKRCCELLEQLTTAVLVLDEDLRLAHLNPAAEALLGHSASHVRGVFLDELLSCEDGGLTQRLGAYLLAGRPYTEHEVPVRTSSGQRVVVDCTATPIFDGALAPAALIEMRRVDRELRIREENRQLLAHQASREMIRGLAHEIKNPLGGIKGAAQLLAAELRDAGQREFLDVILQEADRLRNLLDRMLGPSGRPRKADLELHSVLEHVRRLIASEAPPGVTVQRDYDPSIPRIHADRDLLVQAVLNIARNALQAVGPSGRILFRSRIRHRLTLGRRTWRLGVQVDIVDDGPGVPPELAERLFYPMVSGRPEGTGIGLSIAQMLLAQHGGLIEFESEPGHTVFRMLMPVANGGREDVS